MLSRRLRDLRRRGEMNIAVAQIVAATPVDAMPFGLAPGRSGSDFINRAHGFPGLSLRRLGFSRKMAGWRPTVKAAARQLKRCRTGVGTKICAMERNEAIIPRRFRDVPWRDNPRR